MRRKTNARLALVLCLALVSGVLNVPGGLQGSGAAGTKAYAGVSGCFGTGANADVSGSVRTGKA